MNSEWRTENVILICQAMRETRDYSACPILADALEDAGYDDLQSLGLLRGNLEYTAAERLVATAYSAETASAVAVIEEFAEELGPRAFCEEDDGYGEKVPVTYERMMRVGDRWTLNLGRWGGDTTTEHGSDALRGDGYDFDRFWDAYNLVTGRCGAGNPFSCTC